MPSGCSETKDCNPPEETTSDDTNADQANGVNRDYASYRSHETSSRRLRDRVRIVTLEAEVELLERERATLEEQITELESNVEALEEEITTLEAAATHDGRQLQQVINQYERIIKEKDQAFQARIGESESTQSMHGRSIVSTIKQLLDRGL